MNPSQWPRLLYHKDQAPGGWRIDSEAERARLGPGWVDAPDWAPTTLQHQAEVAPPAQDAPAGQTGSARKRGRSRA